MFGVFVCGTASYDNKASFVDRLAAKVSISVLLRQTEPKSITPTRFRYAVSYRVISCHIVSCRLRDLNEIQIWW